MRINGRLVDLLPGLRVSLLLFLVMLRIVNSPFGRVLQAIRENEFRAEAMGYRTVVYRTLASASSAAVAAHGRRDAGAVAALYRARRHAVVLDIMVDILLMVVIGGMGTMYGAVIGAAMIVMAQYYLQPALGGCRTRWPDCRSCPRCFIPTAGCCGSGCCSS